MTGPHPTVSTVICTHAAARWHDLTEAVASATTQTAPAAETIVVVDHNPALLRRVRAELPGVIAIPSSGPRGASAARNSGVARATGELIAFLDDDAVAAPTWLAGLRRACTAPQVLGAGGRTEPQWPRTAPAWFPAEFGWVVGADYRGLPGHAAPVRGVWTNNMIVHRDVFDAVGGFRVGFGKTGERSAPEDTDFCVRAARAFPGRQWRYEPSAPVRHKVPARRARLGFFIRRCYNEGLGKADLAALLGTADATAAERAHARTLPVALLREIRAALRGEWPALGRGACIAAGTASAAAGYASGHLAHRLRTAGTAPTGDPR